ncbi:helix-turn-helix domain-containing protein [Alcaligenes faecalis]|uniref:Helix-turn-helix transcriptional regulator n=1 Tax=Alcaligenes faecalis TaxID=511 RepID=A0AAE9H9Y1_ALCFA|nr:helix-turn-helix transcriptional regulator [Alcaligenes faecalis]UPL21014.1 helix-turn-helix transcriptional regulator [Alcaligenes faecalis]
MATTINQLAMVLRERAKEHQLTQEALRKSAGISRQTLTNVFSGKADFKVNTLIAVADRLGLDVVLLPKAISHAVEDDWKPYRPLVKSVVDAALDQVNKKIADRK